MKEWFPDLKDVRDSFHHLEDRLRGMDRNKKPLQLKPIEWNGISAPNGGLVLSLRASCIGGYDNDGRFGFVEVTAASMEKVRNILGMVFEFFSWIGEKQVEPT